MSSDIKLKNAEDYLKNPPKDSPVAKSRPSQKELLLTKLRKVKMAIERLQTTKKPSMPVKEIDAEEEEMRLENLRKLIKNYQRDIDRRSAHYNRDDLQAQLDLTKANIGELRKAKHDLEVELEDFKEETRIQQPVSDGELKVWNEKIKRKSELLRTEQELVEKRKEKVERFSRKNDEMQQILSKVDGMGEPKVTGSEIKKLRENIDEMKKEVMATKQKNKNIIREKENQLLSAKNDMNGLIDRLEEVNKIYRVNLHKHAHNERVIKNNLFGNRVFSESQMAAIGFGSSSTSNRLHRSQYRESYYEAHIKNAPSKRDRSVAYTRNIVGKAAFINNGSYLNNSIDSKEAIKRYKLSNRTNSNKFKNMKKNVKEVNSSVLYGSDSQQKLEVSDKLNADISAGNIKLKNEKLKTEADNIKAHLKDGKV
jgi:hypothetical protein